MSAPDFTDLLGAPLRMPDRRALARLEQEWHLRFPDDMALFLSSYGDSVIAGQINVFGPRTMKEANAFFAPSLNELSGSGDGIEFGHRTGQLVLWGTSPDGDAFASEVRSDGEWPTVYFNGLEMEWERDEAGMIRWLHAALSGEHRDVFPDWGGVLPHSVAELEDSPFM